MDMLEGDARNVPECAGALEDDFEDPHLSCYCWNAMGAEYREMHFDCLPDMYSGYTITDLYEDQCLDMDFSSYGMFFLFTL